jgi:Zn finger protein HypA/HybF involved in hydrogenase expression
VQWAVLQWAVLQWAVLQWAVLQWAVLQWAVLQWVGLQWVGLARCGVACPVHELSLVEGLVDRCRVLGEGRTVLEVWVNRPEGTDLEEVRDGFAMLAGELADQGDACLRGARLSLRTVPVRLHCPCGFAGELSRDEVAGHMGVCPRCSSVVEAGTGLELEGMSHTKIEPLGPVRGTKCPKAPEDTAARSCQ